MKGRLEDMAVADLIQHNCQDHKTARVQLKNGRERGELFFKNGNVVHASLDDRTGEQAVYQMMNWDQGTFELFAEVDPPEISITRNWTSLLLEAARITDEGEHTDVESTTAEKTRGDDFRFVEIIQEFSMVPPQQMIEQLSKKIEGHRLTCLTKTRGEGLFWFATAELELEDVIEQVNQFVKMVETATTRTKAGVIRDVVLTTDNAYLVVRFLGRDDWYLLIAADKSEASLGNLRHQADVYVERFLSSLKLEGLIV
jgi:hypothetical protein